MRICRNNIVVHNLYVWRLSVEHFFEYNAFTSFSRWVPQHRSRNRGMGQPISLMGHRLFVNKIVNKNKKTITFKTSNPYEIIKLVFNDHFCPKSFLNQMFSYYCKLNFKFVTILFGHWTNTEG